MKSKYLLLTFLLVFIIAPISALKAQNPAIVLSLALPEWIRSSFNEDWFAEFETAHPDVEIQPIYFDGVSGAYRISSVGGDLEANLKDTLDYVSSADVLYVNWSGGVPVEATRAGYWLNLAPLANADPNLNPEDFIPAVWQSVQWDNGIWALPFAADIEIFIYKPAAFDKAQLAYPKAQWGLNELADAIRVLTQKDSNNNVITPGILTLSAETRLLLRALLGQGLYDSSTSPSFPQFSTPELVALLNTWSQLEQEGVTGKTFAGTTEQLPLIIGGLRNLPLASGTSRLAGALLPGGTAGLSIDGLAVSSGTAYPELAYELAQNLTHSSQLFAAFNGSIYARQSLAASLPAPVPLSPDSQALVNEALSNAIPLSELRFADYLVTALGQMRTEGKSAEAALQEAEVLANNNLKTAAAAFQPGQVDVATAGSAPVVAAGKIRLTFGIHRSDPNLINQTGLDQTAANFTAIDPEVGQIIFSESGTETEPLDCSYFPYSDDSDVSLQPYLDLAPLLDADPAFDRADVIPGVMDQVSTENHIWGYPLTIQPLGLWYDRQQLESLGVVPPETGWTISGFSEALNILKSNQGDVIPFAAQTGDNTHLLMLIAAYNGIPLDYRVSPPATNVGEQSTIEAIRQVLDLVKAGYIGYAAPDRVADNSAARSPIFAAPFNRFILSPENTYRFTLFPQGSELTPISYSVGTGYISSETLYPEACYRWLRALAQHPELFPGLSPQRSLADKPETTAILGADVSNLYHTFDMLLQSPNTILIPLALTGNPIEAEALLRKWLDQAFSQYVLANESLENVLLQFDNQVASYRQCMASIPPFDSANPMPYFEAAQACALSVDPSLELSIHSG